MKKAGFTLFELIVSIAIFSITIGLAFFAFSQGLTHYQAGIKRSLYFWNNLKLYWLHKSLSSTIDYYIKEEYWFPFFEGDSKRMVFVTANPIAERIPVLAILEVEEKNSGYQKLIYYELPVYVYDYQTIKEIIEKQTYQRRKKVVIYEDLERCHFNFLSFDPIQIKWEWKQEFKGKKNRVLPSQVKIVITKEGETFSIDLTLKNNSFIKQIYNEIY